MSMPNPRAHCQPAVSVVIPAHDYGPYLAEAIDSALGQTLPPFEIIVVDDGSTDETPQVLAQYGERIRAFRTENGGAAAARNFGAAQARGAFVAFLDADDVWRAEKLELQIARCASDPSIGFVHCAVEFFGDDKAASRPLLEGLEGWIARDLVRLRQSVVAGPGSSILMPLAVFREAGGFDPNLRVSEDWDLCLRVALRYRVAYVPKALVRYRAHGRGLHRDIEQLEQDMRRALDKAFGLGGDELSALRPQAYGRLHRILSGSYLEAGRPLKAVQHALRSVRYDAANGGSLVLAALRRAARAFR
jgi:glycosyltransferase involved in cell wall biosynthesis